jgi:hypothetical protein
MELTPENTEICFVENSEVFFTILPELRTREMYLDLNEAHQNYLMYNGHNLQNPECMIPTRVFADAKKCCTELQRATLGGTTKDIDVEVFIDMACLARAMNGITDKSWKTTRNSNRQALSDYLKLKKDRKAAFLTN